MKKNLLKLMAIAPGKVFIEIDQHKMYGQTATEFLTDELNKEAKELPEETIQSMIDNDSIIRIEAHPVNTELRTVIAYSWDVERALSVAINQIKHDEKELKSKNGKATHSN